MQLRTAILLATWCAVVGAGAFHWRAAHRRSRSAADEVVEAMKAGTQRRLIAEEERQLSAARSALESEMAARTRRISDAAAARAPASSEQPVSPPAVKTPASPASPELRAWQVQAFVSDQRLRYAALLKRLGLSREKRQAFDEIQATYQNAILGTPASDPVRPQARQKREAQLEDVFGAHYPDWLAANRDEPARAVVNQIVQMTFQGSGALTTAQADELTRIVAQHDPAAARRSGASQSGYDWDRIVTAANEILAPGQRSDFAAAVEFRRVSEKMSAMAAKQKR